ncbi:MAG: DUF2213 domain-containing protein [Candidatus Bathyarchaeota archaeon]|nr:DUF2213 domain-containing protein [Candidatus Bathyarchaeota archaeon]
MPCRWEKQGFASGEECVSKMTGKVEDPEAFCYGKDMVDSQRKIGFDTTTLDDKILVDDDDYLVMPAVIASEIVHQYEDGWAYKPADELEKMAKVASDIGAVPVKILEHPGSATNYLLVKQHDVFGRAENFQFVKNLKDKTGRPMRRGVRADIKWLKKRVPEKVLTQIRNTTLRDVSIGFTFDHDYTPGTWNGSNYDYVQRNIFLNHLAAPIEKGRCPGPVCGIGFDSNLKYGLDEATLKKCPVCRHIADVGLENAGKRLFTKYGSEVLRVISGTYKPPAKRKTVEDLDREFKVAFAELDARYPRK